MMKSSSLRQLFLTVLCAMLLSVTQQLNAQTAFSLESEAANQNTPDGWTAVDLPTLPTFTSANTFDITTYGATTSSIDNTAAIQAALDAAVAAGGGMVVVPAGTFLTSYLQIGSKTVLHLSAGATLKMLAIDNYDTDGNGYHKMENPLITGKSGASDIVIEGESRETSIIDGQGAPWWDEVEAAKNENKSTTRQALIRFWQGSRYLFRNFRIQNAPNTNITIGKNGDGSHATAHDITIKNPASDASDPSHNTDGFPIWTQYVNIYDCEIDTGDDNVVCDRDAQYVHVWNCDLKAGHGASFGSYTHNMHDIIYEDLTFTGTDCGFRLKSNIGRSGDVYNIIFRNSTMTGVPSPFIITSWYDDLPSSPTATDETEAAYIAKNSGQTYTEEYVPKFHDILIKNVTVSGYTTYRTSDKNYYGLFIYGRPESKVYDVTFDNVNITHAKGVKMNFCEGIKFKNCSITVSNTNNTSKNGASTEESLPSNLIEENYQGSYIWNTNTQKAVLSWYLGVNGAEASGANSITGAAGSAAENFTIAITGNTGKNWSKGNGSITYNSTSYMTLKNSNGAQNTVTLPTGMYAHKVEFYAVTNHDDTKGKLSEFNGSSCNDEVSSLKDYSNPTYIAKEFDTGVNSFTFTFSTKQVCFIAIVTYSDSETLESEDPEPAQTYTTVYDIAASLASNIEGNSGSLAPTTADEAANAPDLQVDATNGKLGVNNASWAQLTANTVLTLPGVPEGATITFALYGNTALTINGTAYTNGQTYTTTKDENIVMTCTTDGYIQSITVEGTAFVTVAEPEGYTNTWYFGKSNGAEEFALEKKPEYEYTVNEHSLVINTDAGKLNNASRTDQWAQCNNGTKFKVPVYAGAKLTWGRYNGGSETGFKVDDQLYNEYYIATEDGTVELTAYGISYLSYIKVEPTTLYDISGTISGGDINGNTILLTAAGNGEKYSATVAENAFTMTVPADTYTPELGGDVTYVVTAPESVTVSDAGSIGTITIEGASAQTVTGAITNAPAEAFTLTFTGANHTETVNCAANATSFSISLSPDTYVISSNVGTLSPLSVESFKVQTSAVNHNIYFPEAAVPAATQQNITVDNTLAAASANNYKTVTDALAAAKAGSISSPVIILTSGQTYREQVIVDQPNVTFKTSGEEKATITWYYGIGYAYYSLNANGYYDKDRAMTRNSIKMIDPSRWGTAVLVKSSGNNFKAENIIFENSFNQYYTDEEVTDGVTPNGVQSITYNRTLTSEQTGYKAADSKAVTERAAAIAFENNPTGCQLYNCVFRGSQDTFYSSGKLYVKNCNIIGNTDYIFGGGYVVFDDCDLTIGGYSDQNTSAYITAYKDGGTFDLNKKYVFRDCTVKKTDRQYVAATLGRDWGGMAASVYFFNLKNEIGNKMSYTWTNMGGGVSAGTADLHIYDFDPTVNANYSSTGSTGANVNGVITDETATALYTGVVTSLGFTPEHIYDIPLADNSYYNAIRIKASNGGTGDVTLSRSITAGNWSSIVVPFDISADDIETVFGQGASVAELESGDATSLHFSTTLTDDMMKANQPYAIKVGSDFTGALISGATIVEGTPVQSIDNWDFVGTYATVENLAAGNYYFKNNYLWQATGTQRVKAFRAYLHYTSGSSLAPQLSIIIDGDETTSINTLDSRLSTPDQTQPMYNLSGQRVSDSYKGIVIVNGKKIIRK